MMNLNYTNLEKCFLRIKLQAGQSQVLPLRASQPSRQVIEALAPSFEAANSGSNGGKLLRPDGTDPPASLPPPVPILAY